MMTRGVADAGFTLADLLSIIRRHLTGDFGEIDQEDRQENLLSIEHGYRVMSSYTITDTKVWVITEADRSITTLLFPEDY